MSDLVRRLPGRRKTEPAGRRDQRSRTGAALLALADALAALPEERWSEHTLSPSGGTVADVVAELTSRLSSRLVRHRRAARDTSHPELLERLRDAAQAASAGGRRGLRELAAVVQSSYDIVVPLELPDPVAPDASHAVARARVAAAPAELRTLLRNRSLVAEDAGWRIGSGPEIRGTAGVLVSWLAGRAVAPVFPPRGRPQA